MQRVYDSFTNWERYIRANYLALRWGLKPTQFALAWVLHQPFNVFPIIGPLTVEELDSCLFAMELVLTPQQVAWLSESTDDAGEEGCVRGNRVDVPTAAYL